MEDINNMLLSWKLPILYSLSEEDRIKCYDFAKEVVKTTNYSDTNQNNINKIKFDHYISKLGEVAVYNILKRKFTTIEEPDFTIYNQYGKSFDSDLYIDTIGYAVKSQSAGQGEKYGISWVFQNYPRHDPILEKLDSWVFFCTIKSDEKTARIYPPCQIKNIIFEEPKLDYLKGKKKVVYVDKIYKKSS